MTGMCVECFQVQEAVRSGARGEEDFLLLLRDDMALRLSVLYACLFIHLCPGGDLKLPEGKDLSVTIFFWPISPVTINICCKKNCRDPGCVPVGSPSSSIELSPGAHSTNSS